jgi:Fe2+ or Zn2+ uptake regulation protein
MNDMVLTANATVREEVDRRMAKAGLRWTGGRRSVVDAMHASTAPLSVPDLQTAVGPDVPLSSLYRILGDLVDATILIKLEFAEDSPDSNSTMPCPPTITTWCAPNVAA